MINQVFEFRDVTISYEASGGAGTFELFTDMPGGSMASRTTLSLPVTSNGKGTAPKTFDLEGTTYRAKFTPNAAGTLKPYSATMHVRRIGLYLDGTRGETWETGDIAVNI